MYTLPTLFDQHKARIEAFLANPVKKTMELLISSSELKQFSLDFSNLIIQKKSQCQNSDLCVCTFSKKQ